MATRSLADTYVSIPELMRLARGSYKRTIDAQYAARGIDDEELERRLSAAEIAGMRRGLLALAEIKRPLPKP